MELEVVRFQGSRSGERPDGSSGRGKYDADVAAAELGMALWDWEKIEDPPGRRAELLSGVVWMNPAPRPVHQHGVRLLTNALADACGPDNLAVFDCEWRIPAADAEALHHAPRPDVLVAPASALRGQVALIGQPLEVVEVLSPGNRKSDIGAKRAIYFDHGALHYVEVSISDDEREVSIAWYRRGNEDWEETIAAHGNQVLVVDDPWPLSIPPNDLLL